MLRQSPIKDAEHPGTRCRSPNDLGVNSRIAIIIDRQHSKGIGGESTYRHLVNPFLRESQRVTHATQPAPRAPRFCSPRHACARSVTGGHTRSRLRAGIESRRRARRKQQQLRVDSLPACVSVQRRSAAAVARPPVRPSPLHQAASAWLDDTRRRTGESIACNRARLACKAVDHLKPAGLRWRRPLFHNGECPRPTATHCLKRPVLTLNTPRSHRPRGQSHTDGYAWKRRNHAVPGTRGVERRASGTRLGDGWSVPTAA